MAFISRSAFEIDDYWRIVEVLHKRLAKFDRKHWREPYHALILLEHLITHGPKSTADEFQRDREVIQEMGTFQHIDERGFNWGLAVRKKSERILKLLDKGSLLKEERDRARKVSRGIEGFGSFNQRLSSEKGSEFFRKCNSHNEVNNERGDEIEKLVTGNASDGKGLSEEESKPLLIQEEEIHPFSNVEHQSMESLLSLGQTK